MEKTKLGKGRVEYKVDLKDQAVIDMCIAMAKTFDKHDIAADEVLPVLGTSVVNFILKFAEKLNLDGKEMIEDFAKGLMGFEFVDRGTN